MLDVYCSNEEFKICIFVDVMKGLRYYSQPLAVSDIDMYRQIFYLYGLFFLSCLYILNTKSICIKKNIANRKVLYVDILFTSIVGKNNNNNSIHPSSTYRRWALSFLSSILCIYPPLAFIYSMYVRSYFIYPHLMPYISHTTHWTLTYWAGTFCPIIIVVCYIQQTECNRE